MGIVTMYLYGIHNKSKRHAARLNWVAFLIVLAALGITAVPLYFTSQRIAAEAEAKICIENLLNPFVEEAGWRMKVVITRSISSDDSLRETILSAAVTVVGPPPFPDFDDVDMGALITESCPNVQELELTYAPALFYEL